MIDKALKSIKNNKTAGPTEIVEMLRAVGPLAVRHISHLTIFMTKEEKPQKEKEKEKGMRYRFNVIWCHDWKRNN